MRASPPTPTTGETLFRSLTRPAAPETTDSQLRRYLLERGLGPGDRLPSETELASALGGSRLVIREALCSLEALGLVESRAGSGWFVRPFDVSTAVSVFGGSLTFHPAALMELLAVRRAVESDIVAGVAGRLAPHDLATLDELVDRMRWRAARGEPFRSEDDEFHRRLAAASGNHLALALVDLYCRAVSAAYQAGLRRIAAADMPSMAEEHAAIVDVLRKGDRQAASRVIRAHHSMAEQSIAAWQATQTAHVGAAVKHALLSGDRDNV
jgi:DNA-binding FadR family transcriptional regulator